jgi:hypothetical protein
MRKGEGCWYRTSTSKTGPAGNKKKKSTQHTAHSRQQTADSKDGWNRTSAGKKARPAPAGTPTRAKHPVSFSTNSLTHYYLNLRILSIRDLDVQELSGGLGDERVKEVLLLCWSSSRDRDGTR